MLGGMRAGTVLSEHCAYRDGKLLRILRVQGAQALGWMGGAGLEGQCSSCSLAVERTPSADKSCVPVDTLRPCMDSKVSRVARLSCTPPRTSRTELSDEHFACSAAPSPLGLALLACRGKQDCRHCTPTTLPGLIPARQVQLTHRTYVFQGA